MADIEQYISPLIEQQFPEFYREEGPVFVAFVKKYFEWLETSNYVANSTYADAKQNCTVTVKAKSANIENTTADATFETCFSAGDTIAIYKTDTDYDLFTVNNVVNNAFLYLTSNNLPDFSTTTGRFSRVKTQKNSLNYLRNFYNDMDIDTTSEEFLVYFKEKYLKGIQFSTDVNIRNITKHALDIYRSKGSERAADLLFKSVFGVPATFYYPYEDTFRTSSAKYHIPKYLEISIKNDNEKLVNKQIYGYKSGATAFVEAVIRKSVKGRFVDVLFISAINGEFETGELVNSEDNLLIKGQRPKIIGSLTEVLINVNDSGTSFSNGEVVAITSNSGIGGTARIARTSNTAGIVNIGLENGGFAYTANALVLISNNILTINNCTVTGTSGKYFDDLEGFTQPYVEIAYTNSSTSFAVNDILYAYYANNDLQGTGRIISTSGNSTVGEVGVSILSGDLNKDPLYTASNTYVTNVSSYTDMTKSANVIGIYSNVDIITTDLTGAFETGEYVYQGTLASPSAEGYVKFYTTSVGSNGTLLLSNTSGTFETGVTITGNTSGATANAQTMTLRVGVITNDSFISTTNNYVKSISGKVNGSISLISSGQAANLNISNTLLYTETANLNSDFLIDYIYLDLEHTTLTGNVSVNTTSAIVVGTGTSFTTELRHSVTGNVSVSNSTVYVIGDGTSFLTDISNNDIIEIESEIRRVRSIVNNTFLTVNSEFTTSNSVTTANVTPYVIVSNGSSTEAKRVIEVTNNTQLIVESNLSFACTDLTITTSWGLPGNTSANISYGVFDDIFSYTELTIGKISALTGINPGLNYTFPPIISVFEPLTYSYQKSDVKLTVTGATGSFAEGEEIYQDDNSSLGLVISSNSTHVIAERLRFNDANNFTVTSNSTTVLTGNSSGVTANISVVEEYTFNKSLGYNANISAPLSASNGAIDELEVLVSGFGYRPNEVVTITSNNKIATGTAILGKHGKSQGFYKRKSNARKLHDGLYYQNFSYEIRSSIPLQKYEAMLKQLLHVAGTKYYGAYVYSSEANSSVQSTSSTITVS